VIAWVYKLADLVRDRGRRRFWPGGLVSGRRAEDIAHRFLKHRGMTIVARNYRPPFGGADLDRVGWQADKLVIVEVKSRSSAEAERPERAVDDEKERLLERSARDYVRRAGVDWNRVRFDIVSVVFSDPPQIEWFADAFEPRRTL
jgi:putative endonuclease